MTFRVGQKVVCVDASAWHSPDGRVTETLVKGRIYTVLWLCDGSTYPNPQLRLAEFIPAYCMRRSRFRPVVERATDISIFTAMLNTSKRGVDA